MPKGEKIRPKQEMDQLPLEDLKKNRVRVFVLIVQSWSLVGRRLNYGKKGEFFLIFDQFLLKYLSLCFQQACLT
jgi:hypothetical protein